MNHENQRRNLLWVSFCCTQNQLLDRRPGLIFFWDRSAHTQCTQKVSAGQDLPLSLELHGVSSGKNREATTSTNTYRTMQHRKKLSYIQKVQGTLTNTFGTSLLRCFQKHHPTGVDRVRLRRKKDNSEENIFLKTKYMDGYAFLHNISAFLWFSVF